MTNAEELPLPFARCPLCDRPFVLVDVVALARVRGRVLELKEPYVFRCPQHGECLHISDDNAANEIIAELKRFYGVHGEEFGSPIHGASPRSGD